MAMVDERKALLEERKGLSGVAIPPVTDLEQAIDSWIEIHERRVELRDNMKSQASADAKKEKAVAEVLRDNLSKRLSKKRDFQAVVEAREVVDLEAPGDVIHKRRKIRENLHANRSSHRDEFREEMRNDLHQLTQVFVDYMRKISPPTLPSTPEASITGTSTPAASLTVTAAPAASTLTIDMSSTPTASEPSATTMSNPGPTNSQFADLKAEVGSLKGLKEEVASIKELLLQLVKEKSTSESV